MIAYYNECDPYAAKWLRNLIAEGHIPPGDVDERSIKDVRADDLTGYRQCHFFAGIGGWAYAARLAGWPDDREIWTGSPPCQPFSVAGKQRGATDDRHLWPDFFRLISARRPAVVMGEQVAAAVGKGWLDGVFADMAGIDYACRAVVVPACAVDSPHRRDRLWFVADAGRGRCGESRARQVQQPRRAETIGGSEVGDVADTRGRCIRGSGCAEAAGTASAVSAEVREQRFWPDAWAAGDGRRSAWHGAGWIIGHDGKARRVEPGIRLLAHGVPARVGRLRAYGNAIVPQAASEVISAYLDCMAKAA